MINIKTQKTSFTEIPVNETIALMYSDNYAEIKSVKIKSDISNYRRINSDKYYNHITGEIGLYKNNTENMKSEASLRKTFRKAENVINLNFDGGESEIFLTLCYDYTMTDTRKLNADYNLFRKKFNRHFPECVYVTVVEYKRNGSLHLHIFLKSCNKERLFLDRDLLIKLWGQRGVYIQRINTREDVKRLINYINPLVCKKKRDCLTYYKRNFRILRISQNAVRPKIIKTTYGNALNMLKDLNYKKDNETAYDIISFSDNQSIKLNTIKKIQYRKEIVK